MICLPQAAGLREALDPRIIHKIAELTAKGISKVPEIRKHLDEYVQSALFHSTEQPERTRRRYYPTDIDIRNTVQKAKKEVHTKVDQNNASLLISLWKQGNKDFFEYRPLQPGMLNLLVNLKVKHVISFYFKIYVFHKNIKSLIVLFGYYLIVKI